MEWNGIGLSISFCMHALIRRSIIEVKSDSG